MAELETRWRDLGEFIREQRRVGHLSLRKLSEMAGISNPYLSQIERGLRKPSAEVLQQLASALRVSTPAMYLRAGLLDSEGQQGVLAAIAVDPELTLAQKQSLSQIYETFRNENARNAPPPTVSDETDEEAGDSNRYGIGWLLENQRALLDAEFALNEGADIGLDQGKPIRVDVQTSEKLYMDFRLEVHDAGGHSSQPRPINAIYQLAAALNRIGEFRFPMALNETTRTWFERASQFEEPRIAADMRAIAQPGAEPEASERLSAIPRLNAQMRTTCVATMIEGGHAPNALPQLAKANVNCRILPGHPVAEVEAALKRLAGPGISVERATNANESQPSPLNAEIFGAIERIAGEFWPGAPVIPAMSSGATDGAALRNAGIATYGHSGIAGEVSENRLHGRDERILVKSFYDGVEYLYRLVKALAGGK